MYEIEQTVREVWQRKHDYWRGFKAACIVLTVPIMALVVVAFYGLNMALKCLNMQ